MTGTKESGDTEEAFTMTAEELSVIREFYGQPELAAEEFREMVAKALTFNGIEKPTTEQLLDGKKNIMDGMRA